MDRRSFLLGSVAAVASTALPMPYATRTAAEIVNDALYGVGPIMASLAEIRAANAKLTADLRAFGRAAWIEHGDGRVEVLGPTDLYLPA